MTSQEQKEAQALSCDEEFFKLHVDVGHMNDRRRSFVRRLFATLGDDLDARVMGAAFDADSHPDVVAGNREPEDVRNELVEQLSAEGGAVTMQLFEDYYDLQSITIESDDQFEALVRSSWIKFIRQVSKRRQEAKRAAAAAAGSSGGTAAAPRDEKAAPPPKKTAPDDDATTPDSRVEELPSEDTKKSAAKKKKKTTTTTTTTTGIASEDAAPVPAVSGVPAQ